MRASEHKMDFLGEGVVRIYVDPEHFADELREYGVRSNAFIVTRFGTEVWDVEHEATGRGASAEFDDAELAADIDFYAATVLLGEQEQPPKPMQFKTGDGVTVEDGGYAFLRTEVKGIVIDSNDGSNGMPRGYDVAVLVNYSTPEIMNLFFLEEEVE